MFHMRPMPQQDQQCSDVPLPDFGSDPAITLWQGLRPYRIPDQTAPGKDGDFACHICAREVIPGVRLCVAILLGLCHDAGEGAVRGEGVEDVGQGAAEDALNASDAIARVHQVLEGRNDGQACSDSSLQSLHELVDAMAKTCCWSAGGNADMAEHAEA